MRTVSTGQPSPAITAGEAATLLSEHWGVQGRLTDVGSYEDRNFRVDAADGTYVLKIAGTDVSRAWLERENAAILHLAAGGFAHDLPVPVGDVVRAGEHCLRLMRWVPGLPLTAASHLDSGTLAALGALAAAAAAGLAGFDPPAVDEDSKWDTRLAPAVVDELEGDVSAEQWERLRAAVDPLLALPAAVTAALPEQVIHADVTDYNAIWQPTPSGRPRITGLIDFGDLTRTWRVCDLAATMVAVAPRAPADPLGAMLDVLAGYTRVIALSEAEADAVWPLALARAAACAAIGSRHLRLEPESEYLIEMSRADWASLVALLSLPPDLPAAAVRAACGHDPAPARAGLSERLAAAAPVPVIAGVALRTIDLGVGADGLHDGAWLKPAGVADAVRDAGATIGRWGEARLAHASAPGEVAPATLHLGADVFTAPGTEVRAPLAAEVRLAAGDELLLALGLDRETVLVRLRGIEPAVAAGAAVSAGAAVGRVAAPPDGAAPRVHVQLVSAPGQPGLGDPRERAAWLALCPDPSPLVGAPAAAPAPEPAPALRARRDLHVAEAQELYYERPLEIVRGWGQHLYDAGGRPYLDMINNVAVVGHSHPRVTDAAIRQLRLLNTNSRFLYDALSEYAARLCELLPPELDTVFLVNSGSEACDLALQLARVHTGRQDIVALAGAYHGWTSAVYEACTSPADNPGWRETIPPSVRVAEQPDPYRGRFGGDAGSYVRSVAEQCAAAAEGDGVAGFISEAMLGNQGAVSPPPGYLAAVYEAVRAAGGVCIADEVQVGLGRTGETFWAFEREGVVPDVVTLAKAAGNGHPLGAVVCRRELAGSLGRRAAFFSTPGGGPVSCRIGLAVLDVIAQEGLQENARVVGGLLRRELERIARAHPTIGAVNGRGLYLGVDLVRDRASKLPARALALAVCERVRELGVILQPTGDAGNVLKIKPPLCLTAEDARFFVDALDRALAELEAGLETGLEPQ